MATSTAIWWIRRDLRISDNPALLAAMEAADLVAPLFILDDRLLESKYAARRREAFLFDGLRALDQQLRRRGGRLFIRRGEPEAVLRDVMQETGADRVFAQEDYSPYARQRDDRIRQTLPVTFAGGPTLVNPEDVRKADGDPFVVFTPYARRWKSLVDSDPVSRPHPDQVAVPSMRNDGLPESPAEIVSASRFEAGQEAGERRLQEFAFGDDPAIYRYAEERDRLDLDGTSRLSPYLRFGMLSAGQVINAAMSAIKETRSAKRRKSAEKWLDELIWREFYASILYWFPHVRTEEFLEKYQGMNWSNDPDDIEAWKAGSTGYPVVDACMRQLRAEGWMHNRGRMVTASFLVKHLLVDWRIGEQHFMNNLVDGDPASNNGGWQWTAGTGTDAAPYFRIFNPILQGQRHDPYGAFVRKWIPELERVGHRYIHEPWRMSEAEQKTARVRIGTDFPEPIVDHSFARERALNAYRKRAEVD